MVDFEVAVGYNVVVRCASQPFIFLENIMHQDPEHEDYDDDEHNYYPEYNEYGYPKDFKIDWATWEQWLSKAIQEIVEEENNVWVFGGNKKKTAKKFPVSDTLSNGALSDKYFMYLGSNHYDETMWKAKYFASIAIEREYKNYLAANAAYILKQPNYYRSMFENLN